MRYTITVLSLLMLLISLMPVFAQETSHCENNTIASDEPFDFEYDYQEDIGGYFAPQILDCLSQNSSTENLQAVLETFFNDNSIRGVTEVIHADFTGDTTQDILVNVTVNSGAIFNSALMLFTCDDEEFILSGTVGNGGWSWSGNSVPLTVLLATDVDNNQMRDVVIQYKTVEGQKTHTTVKIYEWNGESFDTIFSVGPRYGSYSHVSFENRDDNPATLEVIIGYY